MQLPPRNMMRLTEGEQSVLLAFIGVGILGAWMSFTIVNQLGDEGRLIRALSLFDCWMILAGFLGSVGGLYVGMRWFGHPGMMGIWYLAKGIFGVTSIAAIVGGTLALPFYGTMFGPFLLALTLWVHPMLASFWVAMLMGSHGLIMQWRRERNTIFGAPDSDDGIPA